MAPREGLGSLSYACETVYRQIRWARCPVSRELRHGTPRSYRWLRSRKLWKISRNQPRKRPSSAEPGLGLFACIIDASSGEITRLEKVDGAGALRQLSEQDKASLRAKKSWHPLEAIVEQAFEAGMACVLGGDETNEEQESEDEAEARRILLLLLMEQSRTMTLLRRGVLGQAILATALQQVTAPQSPEAEAASA